MEYLSYKTRKNVALNKKHHKNNVETTGTGPSAHPSVRDTKTGCARSGRIDVETSFLTFGLWGYFFYGPLGYLFPYKMYKWRNSAGHVAFTVN